MTDDAPLTDVDLALLDRYLADECSVAERGEVIELLKSSPQLRGRLETIRAAMSRAGNTAPATDVSWSVFRSTLLPSTQVRRSLKSATVQQPGRRGRWSARMILQWTVGVAASAALIGVVSHRDGGRALPGHTYRTTAAQRVNITLADGSTVLLGDASTLTVPANFPNTTRAVAITGEAYVTVNHANGVPFTVRVGNTETRVLGTAFFVRKYATDSLFRLVVASGRVSVQTARRNDVTSLTIVTANTMVEANDSGTVVTRPNIVPDDYMRWATGQLVFNDVTMSTAIPELERRYDITIHCDSTLLGRHVTTTLSSERVTDALDILALTIQAKYVRSGAAGRVITLVPAVGTLRRVPSRQTFTHEVQYGR